MADLCARVGEGMLQLEGPVCQRTDRVVLMPVARLRVLPARAASITVP